MAVYIIRAGKSQFVKIGFAVSPTRRLAVLQTSHYETLSVIRVWLGDKTVERRLHLLFDADRVRGEWFRLNPEMLYEIPGLSETTLADIENAIKPRSEYSGDEVPLGFQKRLWRQSIRIWQIEPGTNQTPFDVYERIINRETLDEDRLL